MLGCSQFMIETYIPYPSPLGVLTVAGDGQYITRVVFPGIRRGGPLPRQNSPLLQEACRQLDEYFSGRRFIFDLPLRAAGTPFQMRVWKALEKVPYGHTCSYGQLAAWAGHPRAARAVGGAVHVNPIAILIPCHRVIGADGTLTGYGGGLWRKKFLLELEESSRLFTKNPAEGPGSV